MLGNRSDADTPDDASATSKRREGRGFGPFSGGQLTAIIITIAVLLLLPVGAWAAVSVSHVTITDNTGNRFANVDSKSNLQTAIHDATSGTAAKVNSLGQLSATVSGSVTATPTPPNSSYNDFTFRSESQGHLTCLQLTTPVPTGKALVITSVTVAVASVTTGPAYISLVAATSGSPCGTIATADGVIVPNKGVTQFVPFPQGFAINAGHALGVLLNSTSGDVGAYFTVKGYLVSSSQCTVTGPPTGCY